jgi:hypothetical protein
LGRAIGRFCRNLRRRTYPCHPTPPPQALTSPLAAARQTDLDHFAGWADPERIVGNLHRARAELADSSRGAPIDIASALADMVTYNGGAPLTCLA